MSITLEISPEAEAQIERAAAVRRTDIPTFIIEAATEKAAATSQGQSALRQLNALDDLLALGARLTAGTAPLADDAVARSYEGRA